MNKSFLQTPLIWNNYTNVYYQSLFFSYTDQEDGRPAVFTAPYFHTFCLFAILLYTALFLSLRVSLAERYPSTSFPTFSNTYPLINLEQLSFVSLLQ